MFPTLLFTFIALATLHPVFSGGLALALGLITALTLGNPQAAATKKLTKPLLSLAVMGLGAGVDLNSVARAGAEGFGYTVCGIAFTFAVGLSLARWLNIERNISLLITVGTAICGGSAIAAMSPVIRAKHFEVSVSLAIVFILNALALFLFPPIGHALSLSNAQFGLWSALAIHDTSSVVGASLQYGGSETVLIATTVKLARALWIVPVTLLVGYFVARQEARAQVHQAGGDSSVNVSQRWVKAPFPWFIVGFVVFSAIATYLPDFHSVFSAIEFGARRLLVLTLFLIGANLSRDNLRQVGVRPLALGVGLWIIVASVSLLGVLASK